MTNIFSAGVQYDDFKGSVAADRADTLSLLNHLRTQGWANANEGIVGLRVGFGGNPGRPIPEPSVVVYLVEGEGYVQQPKKVRAVEVNIPIAELFSYFKRFDLVMTNKGLDLSEAKVNGPHYG